MGREDLGRFNRGGDRKLGGEGGVPDHKFRLEIVAFLSRERAHNQDFTLKYLIFVGSLSLLKTVDAVRFLVKKHKQRECLA